MAYENYNVEEFILDEDFKRWVKNPNLDNKNFWENWIKCHPEKSQIITLAREFLLSVNYQNELPSSKDYEEILHKIMKAENVTGYNARTSDVFRPHFIKQKRTLFSLAAVITLLICSIFIFKSEFTFSPEEPISDQFITKENPKGQRRRVTLPDGSLVWLNAESQLIYPEKFGSDRRVHLKGEAFFEVIRDTSRSFIVSSENIVTTVFGTSFNVRAFQNSNEIKVAVSTGRVTVTKNSNESKNDLLMLKPNEMAVYLKEAKTITKQTFQEIEVFGWKDGILYFHNANFNEVKERLEQWYGVSFIFEGKVDPQRVDPFKDFDASYQNQSLETILKGLSFVFDFNFRIKDKIVIIK